VTIFGLLWTFVEVILYVDDALALLFVILEKTNRDGYFQPLCVFGLCEIV
jgi:hypothetical protein